MEGVRIVKKEDSIASIDHMSGSNDLKAWDEGLEVVLRNMKADTMVIFQPYECEKTMQVCYILEGKIRWDESKEFFSAGDCVSVKKTTEPVYFHILEDSKLLEIIPKNIFYNNMRRHKILNEQLMSIQKKDDYTEQHCVRVSRYCWKLGKKMHLSDQGIENLIYASSFHDVGKIHIPIEILNKPGGLTDEEFEIIKNHPRYGFEIIKDDFDHETAKIIEQHHERLDGRGYPRGLMGDEILLEAKIIAVLDSYDAMTSDRPYRKGRSPEEALSELKRCIGTHYEKEIVDKFEEVLKEEGLIYTNIL